MEATLLKHKSLIGMAGEKITAIGASTYVQIGTVVSIIMLTAWLITFKVNAESEIRQLKNDGVRMEEQIKEIGRSLPTREYLDLKFQNIEAQIENLKPKK